MTRGTGRGSARAGQDPQVIEGLDERYVPEEFIGASGLAEQFTQTEQTFDGVFGG